MPSVSSLIWPCSFPASAWLLLSCLLILVLVSDAAANAFNFNDDFEVSWAPSNVRLLDGGQVLQLVLEKETGGAGFVSKKGYLFGTIEMQIKLVPGDSAGTVTAYYLSSNPESTNHDEVDFEFLGNLSGEPYILQTNVFVNGVGGREQRIYLWFDPTADFHTYTVTWSKQQIVQLVDGVPIRVFKAGGAAGYPDQKPMRLYSSLWNGDSWATRGGLVKIDWSHAPFVASYRAFNALQACTADPASPSAIAACQASAPGAGNNIDNAGGSGSPVSREKLDWVKRNYMVYDYCSDPGRYPTPPPECARQA